MGPYTIVIPVIFHCVGSRGSSSLYLSGSTQYFTTIRSDILDRLGVQGVGGFFLFYLFVSWWPIRYLGPKFSISLWLCVGTDGRTVFSIDRGPYANRPFDVWLKIL